MTHYSLKKNIGLLMALLLGLVSLNAYAVDMAEIAALKSQSYLNASQQMPAILQTLHQNPMTATPTPVPQAMLFVSLGMPDALLKQYLQEAYRLKIAVVIRGLYHDSFDATLQRLKALLPKDESLAKKQSGVLINPLWFREYHIDVVPALVVQQGADHDVIFGNMALGDLLNNLQHHQTTLGRMI